MELRNFNIRSLPFSPWLTGSLLVSVGAGVLVFLISLLSPASLFYSLFRGLIAFSIALGECVFFIYLFSKYDLDSLIFGKKLRVDLRSLSSLREFAWVYRVKKEEPEEEKPLKEERESSLEKLLSETSDFEERVEELTEVAKKRPESVAKVIRIMMEEG